jgi:electron transfer flavoprotein beta subunit
VLIGVALKRVDRRPEVDPLTGTVHDDPRSSGLSEADQSALEWALRCAEAWGAEVLAVSAGAAAADGVLRDALAAGAHRAVRVELVGDAPSETVAATLAPLLAECAVAWCGDYSVDRGSGSVPAYLAAQLGAAQALGLVRVDLGAPGTVEGLRRLDGGRRERLRAVAPAVVSVEGATARLRRAPLARALAARDASISTVAGPPLAEHPRVVRPYRPRARVLPAPDGATALQRILALTDAHATPSGGGDAVELSPPEAAERILEALRSWGYLPAP